MARRAGQYHTPAWQAYFDKKHADRLAADKKKKDDAFLRLKGAVELINIKLEIEKEKKIMTTATEVKLPRNAAEQKALVDRQAANIEKAKALKAKFEERKKALVDAREQLLAGMSPKLRAKYEADIDAKNDFESKIADIRAEMHEATDALRTEVSQIKAAIAETAEYLANPISQAGAYLIGSQRRDSIARSLDGAGPKKLSEMFMTARLTGDLELGAEVLAATEKADKKYRFAPIMTIAESLFGPMVAGTRENAKLVEIQSAQIHETIAEVAGVKPMTTLEKTSLALKNPGMGRINPPDAEESNPGVTSTDRISRAMAARSAA